MEYLLRKISRQKWLKNKEKPAAEISSDAITSCIRTQNNTLSVWSNEDQSLDSDDFKDLVTAIATTMERPDTVDFIWLSRDTLEEKGLLIKDTPGNSPLEEINIKHRDLSNLNHSTLGVVAEVIANDVDNDHRCIRISRNKLVKIVHDQLSKKGVLDVVGLSDKWKTEFKKLE